MKLREMCDLGMLRFLPCKYTVIYARLMNVNALRMQKSVRHQTKNIQKCCLLKRSNFTGIYSGIFLFHGLYPAL